VDIDSVYAGKKEDRMMMTRLHTVVDIYFVKYGSYFGWRYSGRKYFCRQRQCIYWIGLVIARIPLGFLWTETVYMLGRKKIGWWWPDFTLLSILTLLNVALMFDGDNQEEICAWAYTKTFVHNQDSLPDLTSTFFWKAFLKLHKSFLKFKKHYTISQAQAQAQARDYQCH